MHTPSRSVTTDKIERARAHCHKYSFTPISLMFLRVVRITAKLLGPARDQLGGRPGCIKLTEGFADLVA